MVHLQFRKQLIRDLVLAAEDGAVKWKEDKTREIKPSNFPVAPSRDKAHETLGSQG
jgi:hypothetical protein